jgi:hypothetical protein
VKGKEGKGSRQGNEAEKLRLLGCSRAPVSGFVRGEKVSHGGRCAYESSA